MKRQAAAGGLAVAAMLTCGTLTARAAVLYWDGAAAGAAENHLGALALAAGATNTIRLGAGVTLSFKESGGGAWDSRVSSAGALGGTSLRFGTDRNGLTAEQLQLMSYNGVPVDIDAAGNVAATRPGTVLIMR
jgi:hypothetical protein